MNPILFAIGTFGIVVGAFPPWTGLWVVLNLLTIAVGAVVVWTSFDRAM